MMKLKDLWVARSVLLLCKYLEDLGKNKKDIEDVLEESANGMREEEQSKQLYLPIEANTNGKSEKSESIKDTKMSGEFIRTTTCHRKMTHVCRKHTKVSF